MMPNSLVRKLPLLAGALVALAPAVATAGELGFVTMDRGGTESSVGVQLGYHEISGDGADGLSAMRLELYGQHRLAGKPFGFYGQMAMSQLLIEGFEDQSALGNLELGGLWMIERPGADVILRAGVSLATASDDFGGFLANANTVVERLVDFSNIIPDTSFIRLSASPILRRGPLFFRADLGLDVPLDDGVIEDVLFHANAAIGVHAARNFALTGELVTVGNLTSDDGDLSERTISTAAISTRAKLGRVSPYASVIVPLDEELRGDVIVFALGAEIAMP